MSIILNLEYIYFIQNCTSSALTSTVINRTISEDLVSYGLERLKLKQLQLLV
ncbi:MAG: hypothetical protein ACI9N9_001105 [Enterobacterales bacterium]|jgi:hypothetical protein